MNMFILAEITSKMDITGVWCLASIVFLAIALFAYCFGLFAGSCTCLFFFVIAIFATGDSTPIVGGPQYTPNKAFITNRSQTKWIEKDKYDINHPDCIFDTPISLGFGDETIFLPAEERVIKGDMWVLKSTGEEATFEDYYIYNKTFAPANISVEDGGMGVPQWLYHPASPIWIFGIGGAPALLVGMFVASKIRGS